MRIKFLKLKILLVHRSTRRTESSFANLVPTFCNIHAVSASITRSASSSSSAKFVPFIHVNSDLVSQILQVMRLLIFSIEGHVLKKIDCRSHLDFPNGVCANEKGDIFVSDNRAHSIKVARATF